MSPEWGRYDQAKADADIAVHAALTTGVHGVGSSAIVGTDLTQTLTAKTLTSPTIQGTVGAGTGLTLPAFTAGGDISLGANKIKTTNLLLKELTADYLVLKDVTDTLFRDFVAKGYFAYQSYYLDAGAITINDGAAISTKDADAGYAMLKARDTGVGLVEVARVQGAADPYFQMTLPFLIQPVATTALPATPVEGMLAYDVTAHKLKVRAAAAWETVSSA